MLTPREQSHKADEEEGYDDDFETYSGDEFEAEEEEKPKKPAVAERSASKPPAK